MNSWNDALAQYPYSAWTDLSSGSGPCYTHDNIISTLPSSIKDLNSLGWKLRSNRDVPWEPMTDTHFERAWCNPQWYDLPIANTTLCWRCLSQYIPQRREHFVWYNWEICHQSRLRAFLWLAMWGKAKKALWTHVFALSWIPTWKDHGHDRFMAMMTCMMICRFGPVILTWPWIWPDFDHHFANEWTDMGLISYENGDAVSRMAVWPLLGDCNANLLPWYPLTQSLALAFLWFFGPCPHYLIV